MVPNILCAKLYLNLRVTFEYIDLMQCGGVVVSIPSGAPESSFAVFPFRLSAKFFLLPALAVLLFAIGCGSNSSSLTGPYSVSSLKGSYVVRLSGNDSFLDVNNNLQSEMYTETLVINADGAGNLTGV